MKKLVSVALILISLTLLSGCQSKTDKILKDAANIKINVDQQTLNEANQAIKETQKKLNGN